MSAKNDGLILGIREEFAERYGHELTLPAELIFTAWERQGEKGYSDGTLFEALKQIEEEQGI